MGFDACRYNGQTLPDKFVEKLKDYVDYHPVCAEVEISLRGAPQPGSPGDGKRAACFLYQPASDTEYTGEMIAFSDAFWQPEGRGRFHFKRAFTILRDQRRQSLSG